MPIAPIILQRRLREVGRIRIGEKVTGTRQDGSDYTRPSKLEVFRLTSRDENAVRAAAELLGGKAEPWEHPRDGAQWEVKTTSKALDVVVPPPDVALSQWLELWSGGGCQRRCDGIREVIGDRSCICEGEDGDRKCRPHTRLSVALPDLESFGLWRLDTLGWNAAAELPGTVEIAAMFAERGVRFLPARLLLEVREDRKPGEKPKKYAVPVLDLSVSLRQVAELAATPATAALPAGHFATVPVAELPEGPGATSVAEAVTTVGQEPPAPRKNAAAAIVPTGLKPRGAGEAAAPTSEGVGGPTADEASAGGHAAPTPDDPDARQRAQNVAMWCRDAGLDDDGRHAFLEAFSRGRYKSAKDVTVDELADLRAALVQWKRDEIKIVVQHDGVPWLIPTNPTPIGAPTPPAEPVDVPPGEVDWKTAIDATPGVGEQKLLNQARKLAHERGLPQPASVADIAAELELPLTEWLELKRRAA